MKKRKKYVPPKVLSNAVVQRFAKFMVNKGLGGACRNNTWIGGHAKLNVDGRGFKPVEEGHKYVSILRIHREYVDTRKFWVICITVDAFGYTKPNGDRDEGMNTALASTVIKTLDESQFDVDGLTLLGVDLVHDGAIWCTGGDGQPEFVKSTNIDVSYGVTTDCDFETLLNYCNQLEHVYSQPPISAVTDLPVTYDEEIGLNIDGDKVFAVEKINLKTGEEIKSEPILQMGLDHPIAITLKNKDADRVKFK